jgi:hypothetical protein
MSEASLFHLKKALGIFNVISPMFLGAWATKRELDVPVECRREGNIFYTRMCLTRMYFYEIVQLGGASSLNLDTVHLHKLSLLCLRLSYSAEEAQKFVEDARNAVFLDKRCHSDVELMNVESFEWFAHFAKLLFVLVALECFKRDSLKDNYHTILPLLRIGRSLSKRTQRKKLKSLLLPSSLNISGAAAESLINVHWKECTQKFSERESFILEYNQNIVVAPPKTATMIAADQCFWDILDSYFTREMKESSSSSNESAENDEFLFQICREALEDEICVRITWFEALKEHVFS